MNNSYNSNYNPFLKQLFLKLILRFCLAGLIWGAISSPVLGQLGSGNSLSFDPGSLSFSVAQNGFTADQTSTLSSDLGTSIIISLTTSPNSDWLILPSPILGSITLDLGPLSFGINASGLAAGTYTSTVTASSLGYADATLEVTLTVTEPPALSFSPTSLSFSVVENSTTANETSILSANTGTPTVTLDKSLSSDWLVLPSADPGSLSFGINSTGLAPGTYSSTVTASASGYASATLDVTLTVTESPELSFSPTSLSFSIVQNGTIANQTSILSANTGAPAVNLTKGDNSNWLILPLDDLGSLSFGINAAGLTPGTYTSTITASASGYAKATLEVTLTVTVPPTLSFSPPLLSFSVVQSGTTANQTSTLSANIGAPGISLIKGNNSNWLVIPSGDLGSLSFGINSAGLTPGTYTSTVTASSSGYTSANLEVTLTVTEAPALSFSPTSLSFSVVQNGITANETSTLSANTGTPTVTLGKSSGSNWLVLPSSAAPGLLSFGINAAGVAPGTYTSTVTASAAGYANATLQVTLTVTPPPALSFSPTSISFSIVQNGTGPSKTSTLAANTGTPTVALTKSANSDWLVLPSPALGLLSFRTTNASALAPGTYTSTVTASAAGYAVATLQVTLTITVAPALSFSPTSLSFSVVQDGTTANKNSTLSANTGTPTVTLTKSGNSSWLVLPSSAVPGSLSFGINATGLAAGAYTSTVTASATGYANATLQVTLTVIPRELSFSPTSLSFSVAQSGTTANKTSILSANSGAPIVTLAKSANSNWLVVPSPAAPGSLSFGINGAGLAPGTYTSTVTASSSGYSNATLQVSLIVTPPPALSFSPTSISFSIVQNGTGPNKTSTLLANTGTPTVTLTKSANSNWLVVPSSALGLLSFGTTSASSLTPGTYTSTVTASASGYASATLEVTLTITPAPALSFSPTTISFSVVQNGTTANKNSTLSANTGTPTVTLTKSTNSNWLALPSSALGSLSFGINATGLAAGTYTSTVTCTSSGYASATLQVTLTVTLPKTLSFSPTPLSFSVVQNGTTANKSSTLSANTGTPTITLVKSTNSNWLVLPSASIGSLSFGINVTGVVAGTYTSTVTASSSGYTSATLQVTLTVTKGLLFSPTTLAFSVVKDGTTANKTSTLSATTGTPTVTLTKTANTWLVMPAAARGSLSFGIKSTGLAAGTYSSTVTAASSGYTSATLEVTLTVVLPNPKVVSVNPANNATNVSENTSISTSVLNLPNSGIDNATITSSTVYLTENATGVKVTANVNGTGGGDAITLVPAASLKLNTTYKFNITSGVKDLSGMSFTAYSSLFTTKLNSTTTSTTAKFTKVSLPTAVGQHSGLKIGPDGKLYALTIDGIIKRFTINSDGTLGTPQLLYSLQDAYGTRKQRLAIGFAFDPSATATNLIAWITHSTYVFLSGPDWDGKLSKLSGSNLQTVQDVLINLPRSAKDHLSNSIAFGPDGALYFTQGSNSAMGRADNTWSNREEHLLSGAVLRLDRSKLGSLPLNVKTPEGGGTYNPFLSTSPLTIYASGVRNAYDLLWHSNGQLYVPANGSAAGGNTPASVAGTKRPNGTTYNGPSIPALTNVQETQKDWLFRIVKGGYYGHPNSLRGEYVLNGGNPTTATDKAQVNAYPIGTLPDANWKGASFDFQANKSPNGVIEYKSSTFNNALKGKILVVRYSQNDDIISLTPSATTKDITGYTEGALIPGFTGFIDPLDLVENVNNGNIYVSEYGGGGKITLLKPATTTSAAAPVTAASEEIKSADSDKHPMAVQVSLSGIRVPSCDEPSGVLVPSVAGDSLPALVDNAENTLRFENNLQKPRVYPNPVEKTFNIEFPAAYKGNTTLQIADPVGKVYDMGKFRLSSGIFKVDISKLFLRSGIYFLRIYSDTRKTEVIKLSVQ